MKTVLVTGGSRGIGAATVKKFAREGYCVILNYNRSQADAQFVCDELRAEGCDVHLVQADVSNPQSVADLFAYIKKYFKKLDVLVNNAGVWRGGTIDSVTVDDYDYVNNVNARGAYLCCAAALPLLKLSSCASVVNVSSVWGLCGASCEVAYSMSKFALVGLTLGLAEEWAQIPIAVNCVCPPIVRTEMCARYSSEDIAAFCNERGLREYLPSQVAQDIFDLATNGKTGVVLREE